jgi:hypothetical protein
MPLTWFSACPLRQWQDIVQAHYWDMGQYYTLSVGALRAEHTGIFPDEVVLNGEIGGCLKGLPLTCFVW